MTSFSLTIHYQEPTTQWCIHTHPYDLTPPGSSLERRMVQPPRAVEHKGRQNKYTEFKLVREIKENSIRDFFFLSSKERPLRLLAPSARKKTQ
jgi:hypothetical protein